MKKSLKLFPFVFIPFFVFSQNYFEPLGGPIGENVKSTFKNSSGVLYAKTFVNFFQNNYLKSYDDGESWTPVLIADSIQLSEIYGGSQSYHYALGVDTVLYRIDQNGLNYSVIDLPGTPAYYSSINISPGGKLFFYHDPNLYSSDNKGVTWEVISDNPPFFFSKEIGFHPNGEMFGITFSNKSYLSKSTNEGAAWEEIFESPQHEYPPPTLVAVHVSSNGEIFVQEHSGDIGIYSAFYMSDNNGMTFKKLISNKSYSAFLTTNDAGDIFYSDWNKIFMSKDKGQIWINISSGLPSSPMINHIYIDHDQYIYLSLVNDVIYKSIAPSSQITAADEPLDKSLFSFEIYPNPTKGNLFFQLKTDTYNSNYAHFKIVDVHGRTVKELNSNLPKETQIISVEGWSPGMYFLQYVEHGEVKASKKFLIARP